MDTVSKLQAIDCEIMNRYGLTSRPAGKTWIHVVLDLVRELADNDALTTAIRPEDLDQLTEENFHTMRTAAEIALKLHRQEYGK